MIQHEKELEQLYARIKSDDKEFKNTLLSEVSFVIDNAKLANSDLVDQKTLSIYRKNHALKKEIALHQDTHERNVQILKDLTEIKNSFAQKSQTQKKSNIICTPDTEFTFSFQKSTL